MFYLFPPISNPQLAPVLPFTDQGSRDREGKCWPTFVLQNGERFAISRSCKLAARLKYFCD